MDFNLKIKLNGKQLYKTNSVKGLITNLTGKPILMILYLH